MQSLFGDEFNIDLNIETPKKPSVKKLLEKVTTAEGSQEDKSTVDKVLKSKAVSLEEKLAIINKNVLSILGKQRKNIVVIKTRQQLHDYISDCIAAGRIDIDTETNNSTDPVTCKLMGPCFYAPGLKQAYVPINHVNPVNNQRLAWQLTETDIKEELSRIVEAKLAVIMHNGKFDYEVIKCTCDIAVAPTWDTIIAARLIDENEFSEKRTSLKYIYTKYIDPTQSKYDIESLFENVPYAYVDPDIFALYAATDALMTDKVYLMQKPFMEDPVNSKINWIFNNIEMPIVVVTAEMELNGVDVDTDFGNKLKLKYDMKLDELDSKISKQTKVLQNLIQFWKTLPSANRRTRVYQPKKSKLTQDKIEARYPLVDSETGKRYKVGKCKAEQISDPISLTSPVQLAILFYDILQCPSVSKKSPRGTGKDELPLLAEKLGNPKKLITNAITSISEEIEDVQVNQLTFEVKDEEETPAVQSNEYVYSQLFMEEPEELEEDEHEQIEELEELDETDLQIPAITTQLKPGMTEAEKTALLAEFKELYTVSVEAAVKLCQAILDRRGIVKLITTYIDVIPELTKHWPDGRIRFHLNSMGTDTGRYSSGGKLKFMEDGKAVTVSGINIQNIPSHNKEIRMLFRAKEDHSNIEANNNCYELSEISEIETTSGWKFGKDLIIGDSLITSDGFDIIKDIKYANKQYYLYI